ncbi:DedA family protein [Thiothrix eikelboomii]|uniref:Membrane protein DedA, SNARE-associated domain n=1 Tax=Thiothrix eikelboomii TaxID=92487 RepID=A0A1T4WLP4_9GAMM|nr:DedA family protein [Thiothrix eikelboomii]SKA78253.1 membrane protein DedA, SNARE-associated domain [Thiothrix eikelboomii]
MLHDLVNWLLETVGAWGYTGIFILMAMESTVLPVPSELVLIPAGYLAHQGEMSFSLILLASTLGSLAGASLNYILALWLGRPFLNKYGKYFFVRPELLQKTDAFFFKHGAISTFTGRLILGIRHLISIPAGLTRMNFAKFSFYTCLGAAVWSLVLMLMGYFIGGNEQLIKDNLPVMTAAILGSVALIITVYYFWQKRQKA